MKEAEMLTPTALAFIGDAVHTLYIRRRLLELGRAPGTLHVAASKYVNAVAQATVFDKLVERGEFTPAEAEIARRAKNAHLNTRAKAASSEAYHKATALESVIGYLEITDSAERLAQILELCAELAGLNA